MDERGPATRWSRLLLGVYLPTLAMSAGQGMLTPTIPLLAAGFGVTLGLAAQLVTANSVGRIVALGPAGVLTDKLGPLQGMRMGIAASILGGLITVFAPNFPLMLLGIVLVGVGNSSWMLGREIAAVDMVGPAQRGRMLSSVFGTSVSGNAFGPVVGGFLAERLGFRSVYAVYLGLTVVTLVLGFIVTEAPRTRRRRVEARGEAFTWRLMSLIHPYFHWTFVVLFAATFGAMLRQAALNSTLPLYGTVERDLPLTQVGELFGIIGLANLAMIGPVGYLSDRWGRKAIIVPSAVFTAASFILYPLAQDMLQLVGVTVVMGIGSGLSLGSMTISTYDIVPERRRGMFQSLRRAVGETGSLLGPAVAGVVTDLYVPSATFWVLAPMYVVIAALAIFVARETHPLKRPEYAVTPA